MKLRLLANLVIILGLIATTVQISRATQIPARTLDEARTVYLGNLARRANGLPPLRWNRELTDAARWFAWDSVENRVNPYCGHQDTHGDWPDDRAGAYGYTGSAGAENAFCGYVSPEAAINGWLNSPGHRANLLDPNSREVGLGTYLRDSDGRGYIAQGFGVDAVYPPVIIDNEAISTTTSPVNLYIYDRASGGGFAGMGPATQMMVGNDPCFIDTTWQPYTAEKAWTLTPGEGWRTVYVKTRDTFGRTVVVSDTIYAGSNVPLDELGEAQMSTTRDSVTLYDLNGGGLPYVQFSLGWLADDTFDTFGLLWGAGERVSDPAAQGGTAFRLAYASGTESSAWVWTTDFIKDVPLTAYVRLKVSDNTSSSEVARFSATGGGTLSLKGTDFRAANAYQEFPLNFTFNSSETFLTFQFWRSQSPDVTVDSVSLFTAPQPVTSTLTWNVPGGNARGQGIWVRYTNGSSQFSPISEGHLRPQSLSVAPSSMTFLAGRREGPPLPGTVNLNRGCEITQWRVTSNADWLAPQTNGDSAQVHIDHARLSLGAYQGMLTFEATGGSGTDTRTVPVTLIVVEQLNHIYLPMTRK